MAGVVNEGERRPALGRIEGDKASVQEDKCEDFTARRRRGWKNDEEAMMTLTALQRARGLGRQTVSRSAVEKDPAMRDWWSCSESWSAMDGKQPGGLGHRREPASNGLMLGDGSEGGEN